MSNSRPSLWIILAIIVILILFILLRTSCCKIFCNNGGHLQPDTTAYSKNHGLNILFKQNVSFSQKENVINEIKDSIKEFYRRYELAFGMKFTPEFLPVAWCPCDSALYTVNFTCLDGAGKSKDSPPTPVPVGGSGDLTDVLAISQNMPINEINKTNGASAVNDTVIVSGRSIDNTKILAIIDTGIDSTLFPSYLSNLIWRDPSGKPTLYNFIPNQPVSDMSDNGATKHGSAVTAIAIKAMQNSPRYPRLMILKALDSAEKGTTFSVSCALSYALQNHATLVNASLGYTGRPDSVMLHYITLCAQNTPEPIQLFFAAGNTYGAHDNALICSSDFNYNLLKNDSLFYPACFSKEFTNIMSVTQIRQPNSPCYYQFFSKDYIKLGVLNTDTSVCCSFKVNFIHNTNYYEGSSFATPFASGLKMTCIINLSAAGGLTAGPKWEDFLQTATSGPLVTEDGRYIFHQEAR